MHPADDRYDIDGYFLTSGQGQVYRAAIQDTEKGLIHKALQQSRGNQISAARLLGMNRNTLRSKIRKLEIDVFKYKT